LSENDPNDEIKVVAYDPGWRSSFALEANKIKEALGDLDPMIEHIGSTAIPGLCAKPIIDIMVGVRGISDRRIVRRLDSIGYLIQTDAGDPDRLFFRKGKVRTHHLHVVDLHGWAYWRHVIFRDYLISHPSWCARYAEIKLVSAQRYRFDRIAYTESKSDFIESVLKIATLGAFIIIDGQYTHNQSSCQLGEADVLRR
jgi:GrpB-like predicted nucleotidyltransferase (UPF0157 family)